FKPSELVALREVLDDYHVAEQARGHRSITAEQGEVPIGFAYYAPASMTERAWYLYWIAVAKAIHARGFGSQLLHHAEREIEAAGGRILFIETSSLPQYEPTRRFYQKRGYETACVLGDFYADGDDLVVFRKRFAPWRGPGGGVE